MSLRRSLARALPCALPCALLALLASAPAAAQIPYPQRPYADWKTIETEHYRVHYPQALAEWTLEMASRIESVHDAVTAMVGSEPTRRIDVVVSDPLNVSNGSAWPGPAIWLWPTPPEPRSHIGQNRGWAEILSVHEYAHIAHLTRPSRNPRTRLLWSLLPVPIDPIMRKAPRWSIEGYATYIEGKLTGNGRPHGVWRPAMIRQWAAEGKLPTYQALSGMDGYLGGAMAYMVGSAFLEWLDARHGEGGLPKVWARMTAKQDRSFDEAFRGVYGDPPADLYGRFVAEATAKAVAMEAMLDSAGRVDGELIARREGHIGDLAVSPDGRHIAMTAITPDGESRLVVIRSVPDTMTAKERKARERMLAEDPQDVPAIEKYPRPRTPVATLLPVDGRSHQVPRFLDDQRLLVTRLEPLGDGTLRPDLFVWNFERGELRRVTRGAGIRDADPLPGGLAAVGTRCLAGSCDIVRVELATGRVAVLLDGEPTRNHVRPRVSPDGSRIALASQDGLIWRPAVMDVDGGGFRFVGPADSIARFDPEWLDASRLVVTSERGGVHNLAVLDVATGEARPVTRVFGAALAPAADRTSGAVYFASLHSKGMDLRRVVADSVPAMDVVRFPRSMVPVAAVRPVPADTFAVQPLPPARDYGLGPRRLTLLPGGWYTPQGSGGVLAVASTDPVGRFGWLLTGAYGEPGTPRGGSLRAEYRGWRPEVGVSGFWLREEPSRQRGLRGSAALIGDAIDAEYYGGAVDVALARDAGLDRQRLTVGGSYGRIAHPDDRATLPGIGAGGAARGLGWVTLDLVERQGRGTRYITEALTLHGGAGRTGDAVWRRALGTVALGLHGKGGGLTGSATYGRLDGDVVPYEVFVLGGLESPLVDPMLLAQRIAAPSLPAGVLAGTRLLSYRVTLAGEVLAPYFQMTSVDDGFDDWYRVIGSEFSGSLESLPLVRLPGIRLSAGTAYALDEPYRRRWRAHIALSYQP